MMPRKDHKMQTLATLNASIDADVPLNAIVARYPQTLPVLQRFGLDTCCGGALPLRIAAKHHDLQLEDILRALHVAISEDGR
jgi:iron-sulfur cluster repair protein YtfE (RIC family)